MYVHKVREELGGAREKENSIQDFLRNHDIKVNELDVEKLKKLEKKIYLKKGIFWLENS